MQTLDCRLGLDQGGWVRKFSGEGRAKKSACCVGMNVVMYCGNVQDCAEVAGKPL